MNEMNTSKYLIQYMNKWKTLKELWLTQINMFDVWANAPQDATWVAMVKDKFYRELDMEDIYKEICIQHEHCRYERNWGE